MSISLEVLIILALILVNGLLAMAEIAVVSARKARLQQRAEEGDSGAKAALQLARDPADFLSTVQIGITLVGVLAGAFGGATIAEQLAANLSRYPAIAPYSEGLAVALVVVAITYLSLVLGELAPKRLALGNPERVAAAVAAPLRRLARLAAPLVRLLSASAGLVLRVIGVHPSQDPPVTEDEIKVLIDQGTQAGIFAETEQDMLEAVFRLADLRVDALMTPRRDIIWLDLEDALADNLRVVQESTHDRFPVGQASLDQLTGIVQAKDLLDRYLSDQPVNLGELVHEPLIVPESTLALRVVDLFRETRQHMALVIDEFGGVLGLVTAFDLLEAIVGDIPTGETTGPGLVEREDGSWLVDGRLLVQDFKDALGLPALTGDNRGYYQTMGGFMMTMLGRIPAPADAFDEQDWRFEVVDMDGLRVDKLLVKRLEK